MESHHLREMEGTDANPSTCLKTALFLANIHGLWARIITILSAIIAMASAYMLCWIVPTESENHSSSSPEANSSPDSNVPLSPNTIEDLSPSITSKGQVRGKAPPSKPKGGTKKWQNQLGDIEFSRGWSPGGRFALGTALLGISIFLILCSALAIQSESYCQPGGLETWVRAIRFTIFVGLPAVGAGAGAACWFVLLRDVLGPKLVEKLPMQDGVAAFYVLRLFLLVVVFPLVLVLKAGKECWKRCYPRGREQEDDEVDLQEMQTAVLAVDAFPASGTGAMEAQQMDEQQGDENEPGDA